MGQASAWVASWPGKQACPGKAVHPASLAMLVLQGTTQVEKALRKRR